MSWQDIVLVMELVILIGIYLDDHEMRRLTKKSLEVSREGLEVQKQYLGLRRKWFETRLKKKDEKAGNNPGDNQNPV
jgi:hypothetical protein